MSDALTALMDGGMALDVIRRRVREGATPDEIIKEVGKVVNLEGRRESAGEPAAVITLGQRVSIDVVAQALRELGIVLRYNQLLKEIEIQGLPGYYSKENAASILPVYLIDYLNECGCKGVTSQTVSGCLACIADRNRYNPILEYVQSGTWDGQDRLPEIYRILGVTSERHQTYIKKWFVQCIALGLNDEERPIGAEGVLVLQGKQGLAKTSFFRIMTPFPRWFVEGAVIDTRSKDSLITALSGWITEMGELDSTLKKEQSSLKGFVTNPTDRIRMPYARTDTNAPRRTSFCGTVNPSQYLRDENGTRRFWTVPVTSTDKKALFSLSREWVKQLWFQVYGMYQAAPNSFRLTDAEMEELQQDNREFSVPMRYEVEITEMLNYAIPASKWEWWTAAEVAKLLPGVADAVPVGKALTKIAEAHDRATGMVTTKGGRASKLYLLPLCHYWRDR